MATDCLQRGGRCWVPGVTVLRSAGRLAALGAAAGLLMVGSTTSAWADNITPSPPSIIGSHPGSHRYKVVIITTSSSSRVSQRSATPRDLPACWRVPFYSGAELVAEIDRLTVSSAAGSVGYGWLQELRARLVAQSNDSFNTGVPGLWWGVDYNYDLPDPQGSCGLDPEDLTWVPPGTPVARGISVRDLAEMAAGEVTVPVLTPHLSPIAARQQVVNLDTWVWAPAADVLPYPTGHAEVPGLGLSADVTLVPVGMTLQPGTSWADTTPTSGVCPIHVDGSIGIPWTGNLAETPTCAVTYRHASTSGPYELNASVRWEARYTGSNGVTGVLPPDTTVTRIPVTVAEIQSVVTTG